MELKEYQIAALESFVRRRDALETAWVGRGSAMPTPGFNGGGTGED